MSFSIADVETLAKTSGANRSAALLRASTEVYLREASHSDRERQLFAGIFADLYDGCDAATKRAIAALVAPHGDVPAAVLRRICEEEIDIARPVIVNAPTIEEPVLLRLCGLGRDTLMALAKRADLPASVLQAALESEDHEVIGAILANRRLSLSGVPTDALLAAVGKSRSLCDALALRHDVAGDRLVDIFLDLGRAGRQRVVAAIEHRLLGASLSRSAGGRPATPQSRSHYPLYKAIYTQDRAAIVSLLSQDFHLRRALVDRIVDDATGEALAVLLRATGMPADRAIAAFADINPALGQSSDLVRNVTRFYDRISFKAAMTIIDRWRALHPVETAAPPHLAARERRLSHAESQRELAAPASAANDTSSEIVAPASGRASRSAA